MSLFERLYDNPLKTQARETGVPAPILKKVYARGVEAAKATPTADKDAWGKARVDAFVRGGVDRAKDTDLWQKYHQEPQAEKVESVVLPGNDVATPKSGVFIPLPDTLARYFPKKAEDTSVPHLTLLFVGEITPEDEKKLVEVVRSVADRWPPFRADVVGYGEFENKDGATIAHMIPSASICLSSANGVFRGLADLHADLYAALDDAGLDAQHNYKGEKFGDYGDRVAAYKPHVTLDYVPAGGKYTGPKPTGSWQVTEIEVWGHEKYRIPLGLKAQWVAVPTAMEPDEEEADGPSVDVVVQTVNQAMLDLEQDDSEPVETPIEIQAKAPIKLTGLKEDGQSSTASPAKANDLRRALSPSVETPKLISLPMASSKFTAPPVKSPVVVTQLAFPKPTVKAEALVETQETPGVTPVETPVLQMETPVLQMEAPQASVVTLVPVPTPEIKSTPVKIRPIQFFERFGHLSDSVLEIGGHEEHDYARLDPLDEDDHASRLWKTVVCGTLHDQTPSERVSTLLAARGLLAVEGQVLVALPAFLDEDEVARFERLFGRFFNSTRLTSKGLLAWSLTSNKPVVEQAQPAFDQSKMPPINLGPVYIRIPERQVQVQVHAPITQQVDMPANPPQQVTIAKGAVQIDMHQPPPSKKRVTMVKDGNGRVTGELEVVEDREVKRPEFPTVEEIFAEPEPSSDAPKQE